MEAGDGPLPEYFPGFSAQGEWVKIHEGGIPAGGGPREETQELSRCRKDPGRKNEKSGSASEVNGDGEIAICA